MIVRDCIRQKLSAVLPKCVRRIRSNVPEKQHQPNHVCGNRQIGTQKIRRQASERHDGGPLEARVSHIPRHCVGVVLFPLYRAKTAPKAMKSSMANPQAATPMFMRGTSRTRSHIQAVWVKQEVEEPHGEYPVVVHIGLHNAIDHHYLPEAVTGEPERAPRKPTSSK